MKISDFSIQEISKFIIGDSDEWPHRTRRDLIDFFNKLGLREMDYHNSDSKAVFAKNKVTELNGKPELKNAIKELLDPRRWTNITSSTVEDRVVQINEILKYDNYEVIKNGNFYKVRELVGSIIKLENHFAKSDELSELLIEEQIKKCREKIENADYPGAITNARSLIEAVCVKIEADLDSNPLGNGGDLIKLFNRVRNLLNLDPSRKDISDSLRQVLSGLLSIVYGLSAIRNSMSDAHAMPYQPSRHHAKLAVNSAKTLVDFLFDTMSYQIEKGILKKKVN